MGVCAKGDGAAQPIPRADVPVLFARSLALTRFGGAGAVADNYLTGVTRMNQLKSLNDLSLRFVRWSGVFLVLGLLTGYGPLGHYLLHGVEVACPAAPVHGHLTLLGWLGMAIFGVVYRSLPGWAQERTPDLRLIRIHFRCCVIAVAGVFLNGALYPLLGLISPGFYYVPDKLMLNIWLSIDGLFLTLYGLGCLSFVVVLFRSTGYTRRSPDTQPNHFGVLQGGSCVGRGLQPTSFKPHLQ